MLRKSLRITIWVILVIGFILLVTFSYQIGRWVNLAHGNPVSGADTVSILDYYSDPGIPDSFPVSAKQYWFESSFDPKDFVSPPMKYRPWLRWWLPGNQLDDSQLEAELNSFYQNGFGGVEIYPLSAGILPDSMNSPELFSVDSKSYFDRLRKIMQQAQRLGMFVDLIPGSGMPAGGPHVGINDNLKSLAFGERHVLGGKTVKLPLPAPKTPLSYYLYGFLEDRMDRDDENMMDFWEGRAEMLAIFAAKTLEEKRSGDIFDLQDYVRLDPDSIFLISEYVNQKEIIWQAPVGFWKIIAVYSIPSGSSPVYSAYPEQGYVVDYFDGKKVVSNYNYHFGTRSGLVDYFSSPLRGVFNDQFTFNIEQHYSPSILSFFKEKRSYDPTFFLPVLLYPGKDNFLINSLESKRSADYLISENDERIRRDYAQTISDLFIDQYLDSTLNWAEKRGLLHRAQPYGMSLDIIRASGHTHIPEAEQYYGGGNEMFLKLVSSGAHLYNRPIVSAEALSHDHLAYLITPQRMKIAVDKLFGSGFNQVVFHGAPYHWADPQFGEMGWIPFASPFYSSHSISSAISSLDPFWKHQSQMNQYISRSQYLLRQGNPQVDVLVYYPFLGFPHEFHKEEKHDEQYFNGLLYEDEKAGRRDQMAELFADWLETEENPKRIWLRKTWEILQALERQGISWDWVNDESLQEAKTEAGNIYVRGNRYQALILPEVETIEVTTARNLAVMTRQGGRIIVYGKPPARQPGFFNFDENEVLIGRYMKEVAIPNSIESPKDLQDYFVGNPIDQEVSFDGVYDYIRFNRRILPDESQLLFLRNTFEKDRYFMMRVSSDFDHLYWLDPWAGSIHALSINGKNQLKGFLHGYGSGFLYCSKGSPLPDSLLSPVSRINQPLTNYREIDTRSLDKWDIIVVGNDIPGKEVSHTDTSLFDWREHPVLRYSSSEGFYRTTFELADTLPGKRYILDLGNVESTADVKVNAEPVGSCIIRPFRLDISHLLLPGFNTIEIWITPSLRNRVVGKGLNGEDAYERFNYPSVFLVPTGLLGPVVLWEVDKIVNPGEADYQ